jgi:D-3-phosphoglycerate dehydrogenase
MIRNSLKIVVTDYDYPSIDLEEEMIKGAGFGFQAGHAKTEDEAIAIASGADGVIAQYAPMTERVLESLPRCKVISRYGVGLDNVDVEAATRQGIIVCNAPRYCINEVSNHAIALMLALSRKVVAANAEIRRGIWDAVGLAPIMDPAAQVVGVVGLGNIGRTLVKKVIALGNPCIAYDPYKDEDLFRSLGVERVDLEALLRKADIVSLHTSLTKETYHLIGEEELSMMKPTAFLINTSRGKVVDQKALYRALKEKRIAGAALDVLEEEPPTKDDPLLSLDSLILTPHLAFYSDDSIRRLRTTVTGSVIQVLRGETPEYVANPDVLKRR